MMWLRPTFSDYFPDVHHVDSFSGSLGYDPLQRSLAIISHSGLVKEVQTLKQKEGKTYSVYPGINELCVIFSIAGANSAWRQARRVITYAEEFWLHGASKWRFYEFSIYLCVYRQTVFIYISLLCSREHYAKKCKKKNLVSIWEADKKPLITCTKKAQESLIE